MKCECRIRGDWIAHCPLCKSAPDMLDWIKTLENDDGCIPEWLWKQRAELIAKAEAQS